MDFTIESTSGSYEVVKWMHFLPLSQNLKLVYNFLIERDATYKYFTYQWKENFHLFHKNTDSIILGQHSKYLDMQSSNMYTNNDENDL